MGEGEDDVVVLHGQEFVTALLHPAEVVESLAFGAAAVPAGVVGGPLMSAFTALLEVPAEYGGAAVAEGVEGFVLHRFEGAAAAVVFSITVDDVGNFKAGFLEGCGTVHIYSIADWFYVQ